MKKPWLFVAVSGIAAFATLAFVRSQEGGIISPGRQLPRRSNLSLSPTTPMPGGLPRSTASIVISRRSVRWMPGCPSVSSCMGCHIIVQGRNKPEEVQKLRDYWDRGESIPWVRIYKVADHVKFPHMRHVAKDAGALECQECHGRGGGDRCHRRGGAAPEDGVVRAVPPETTMPPSTVRYAITDLVQPPARNRKGLSS